MVVIDRAKTPITAKWKDPVTIANVVGNQKDMQSVVGQFRLDYNHGDYASLLQYWRVTASILPETLPKQSILHHRLQSIWPSPRPAGTPLFAPRSGAEEQGVFDIKKDNLGGLVYEDLIKKECINYFNENINFGVFRKIALIPFTVNFV